MLQNDRDRKPIEKILIVSYIMKHLVLQKVQ
jgi:hypothetical protein